MPLNKYIICIQVRNCSKRLKNKALITLYNNKLIEILINRLKASKKASSIVLCTSNDTGDDILQEIAIKNKIDYIRGSKTNIASRFVLAANKNDADYIVRVTGDDILTDVTLLDNLISQHQIVKSDYLAYKGLPNGVGAEIISKRSLSLIADKADDKIHLEYLTWYLEDNSNNFEIKKILPDEHLRREDIRITLDYQDDLIVLILLLSSVADPLNINTEYIIRFLDNNPEIKMLNSGIKQKSRKSVNINTKLTLD